MRRPVVRRCPGRDDGYAPTTVVAHEELHEIHHIPRRRPIDGGVIATATPVGASGTYNIYQHPHGYWAKSGFVSDIPIDKPKPAGVSGWDSVNGEPTFTFFYDDGDEYPTYYRSNDGVILKKDDRAYPLTYMRDEAYRNGDAAYPDGCTFNNEGDLHPAFCTIGGKVYRPVHHPHPSDDVHRSTATLRPPRADRIEQRLDDGFTRSTAETRNADGYAYKNGDEDVEVFYKVGNNFRLRPGSHEFYTATAAVTTTTETSDGIEVEVKEVGEVGAPRTIDVTVVGTLNSNAPTPQEDLSELEKKVLAAAAKAFDPQKP